VLNRPPPPPRHASRAPEWVGEGDTREDVSGQSDRRLNLRALHEVLCLRHDLGGIMTTVSGFDGRLQTLEGARPPPPPPYPPLPPMRAESPSSSELIEMFANAGKTLTDRIKDPRDSLNSDRARKIAGEMIEQAKVADDASAFRKWRARGGSVVFEVVKLALAVAVAALAYKCGLSH
jgi:hypothetical protein